MKKLINYIIPILVFTFFTGCQTEKKEPLPFDDEKILSILHDVHIAEAALQSLGRVARDTVSEKYYNQICEIQKIERQEFDNLMIMLRNRPRDLNRLYNTLFERMEIRDKEIKASQKKEKAGEEEDIIEKEEKKKK